MTVMLPRTGDVQMETLLANSYRDFHAKGLDYICLRRSPDETIKLYFFDGDVSKLPEVVSPHDHRYDFSTLCVAGAVENKWYAESKNSKTGKIYNRFAYETPLLGGNGFTWVGETELREQKSMIAKAGRSYMMHFEEIHTIRMVQNNSVLCLIQYEDKVAVDRPTLTFMQDRQPPPLDDLYRRWDADDILAKLRQLQERSPGLILPKII